MAPSDPEFEPEPDGETTRPLPTLTVTFDTERDHERVPFPLSVEVGGYLFERYGGTLAEMDEGDRYAYATMLQEMSPRAAIDEALEIIDSAPGFDHVRVSEVDAPGVDVEVTYESQRPLDDGEAVEGEDR